MGYTSLPYLGFLPISGENFDNTASFPTSERSDSFAFLMFALVFYKLSSTTTWATKLHLKIAYKRAYIAPSLILQNISLETPRQLPTGLRLTSHDRSNTCDPELILIFLRNLRNSIGIDVYETSMEDEIAASILMKEIKLDFDDSLQYYVAKKLDVKAIVSYDKTNIPRKEL